MMTTHKYYGITANIDDMRNGKVRLLLLLNEKEKFDEKNFDDRESALRFFRTKWGFEPAKPYPEDYTKEELEKLLKEELEKCNSKMKR